MFGELVIVVLDADVGLGMVTVSWMNASIYTRRFRSGNFRILANARRAGPYVTEQPTSSSSMTPSPSQ